MASNHQTPQFTTTLQNQSKERFCVLVCPSQLAFHIYTESEYLSRYQNDYKICAYCWTREEAKFKLKQLQTEIGGS